MAFLAIMKANNKNPLKLKCEHIIFFFIDQTPAMFLHFFLQRNKFRLKLVQPLSFQKYNTFHITSFVTYTYKVVPCFILAFQFWRTLCAFCFSAIVELNWLFVDRNKIHSGTKICYIPDYPRK